LEAAAGRPEPAGDGIPDIVAIDTSTENSSLYEASIVAGLNDGKGNFTYSTLISGKTAGADNLSGIEPFLVDLNGDGKADLLLDSNSGSGLLVSLNNGDGTYATPVAVTLTNNPACPLNYIDVGDVNGDGFPDIVAAYGGDSGCSGTLGPVPSGIYVLLNNGKGSFTSSFTPFGLSAYLIKLADLNGDGKLDLAVTDYSAYSSYFYSEAEPSPTLQSCSQRPTTIQASSPSPTSTAMERWTRYSPLRCLSDMGPLASPNSSSTAGESPSIYRAAQPASRRTPA